MNQRRMPDLPAAAVAALAAAALFAILSLLVCTSWPPLVHFDAHLSADLHGVAVRHHGFTTVMRAVSAAGTTAAWLLILTPFLVWLTYRRQTRLAVFVVLTATLSSLLNTVVKAAVRRPRPHLSDPLAAAHATSFPSGHAQAAVVCVGLLALILLPAATRRARMWLVLAGVTIVLTIGVSRIALGVHYPFDVLGGYLLGAAWLLAMTYAFQRGRWRDTPGARSPSPASAPRGATVRQRLPSGSTTQLVASPTDPTPRENREDG